MKPLLTILIPTWNSERFIRRALISILNNGYDNFEVRVMDNHSTDKTEELVKSFRDKRIKFISQSDGGIYEALNRGIKTALGEIIGWLGCDDFYQKGCLEKVAEAFKSKEVNWIVGEGNFIFEEKAHRIVRHHLPQIVTLKQILIGNPLISPSVFFRKDFFNQVGGFDAKYKLAADYDLWIKFSRKENPLILREALSNFSYHASNASSKRKIEMYKETLQILHLIKEPRLIIWKNINIARLYLCIAFNLFNLITNRHHSR